MESADAILKKIRRLELKTRGLVSATFSGQYRSVFKGRGMNFEEVREYQPGDDVRAIDWNVTARTGNPLCFPHGTVSKSSRFPGRGTRHEISSRHQGKSKGNASDRGQALDPVRG